jgi:hypothetical protein
MALDPAVVPTDAALHALADVPTGVVQDQHEDLFAFSGDLQARPVRADAGTAWEGLVRTTAIMAGKEPVAATGPIYS